MDEDYIEEDMNEEGLDSQQGEPSENREQVMQNLFNTEERIARLRHNWRGDIKKPIKLTDGSYKYIWKKQLGKELAGDSFINKQMSAVRSICNPTNAISKKSDTECLRILHDAVDTFIRDLVNEPTIERKDYRTLTKSFEHTIELFLGLVEAGHGAKVLNDALAGVSQQPIDQQQKRSLLGWEKRK